MEVQYMNMFSNFTVKLLTYNKKSQKNQHETRSGD